MSRAEREENRRPSFDCSEDWSSDEETGTKNDNPNSSTASIKNGFVNNGFVSINENL